MEQTKYVKAYYEPEENIIRMVHPIPINLNSAAIIAEFFREVTYWLQSCPTKPYLLVDYTNLEVAVNMTDEYSAQLRNYRPMVLGVFRYGVSSDLNGSFTTMTIRLGNMRSASSSNIYPDEASARQALLKAKAAAMKQ